MFTMCGIAEFTIAATTIGAEGYKVYLSMYALSKAGMVVSTVYLIVLCLIVAKFYKNFYNNAVTSY